MKNLLLYLILFIQSSVFAQVGIGTTIIENGVALKVESSNSGILIPRVALTSRNVVAPIAATPPQGTLIYNTTTSGTFPNNVVPGFYFWDGLEWRAINDTKINKTAKFNNNSTSTDYSSNAGSGFGVFMELFSNTIWNEEPSMYNRLSNTEFRVTESGLYEITVNMHLDFSDIERYLNIRLNINGVDIGENFRAIGPEDSGSNGTVSVNFTCYNIINANDVIRINSYRDGSNTTATFASAGTSTFTIKRIR